GDQWKYQIIIQRRHNLHFFQKGKNKNCQAYKRTKALELQHAVQYTELVEVHSRKRQDGDEYKEISPLTVNTTRNDDRGSQGSGDHPLLEIAVITDIEA